MLKLKEFFFIIFQMQKQSLIKNEIPISHNQPIKEMKLVGIQDNKNKEKITLIPLEPSSQNKISITTFKAQNKINGLKYKKNQINRETVQTELDE